MNRLIKNEFKKLFSKKLMYILFIIAIGFVILNNVMSSIDYNEILNNEKFDKMQIDYYEQELANLDYRRPEDNSIYIDLKTSLDLTKLQMEYDYDSWQRNFIISANNDIYDTIWNINQNTYGLDKDEELLKEYTKKYDEIKSRLNSENWRIFLEEQLKESNNNISEYKKIYSDLKDKKQLEQLEDAIKQEEITKKVLEWRLEKGEPYGNSFLSNAISSYENAARELVSLEKKENKTKDEENTYKECLKTEKTNLYYIENDIRISKMYTARDFMEDFNSNYGAFITIFSVIVAGTIVSSEFQKGTIKLLLTRPYSRTKILFSKYIVSLVTIILFIVIFLLGQYIIGGIVFGFDSYNIPIVEYDFAKNTVVTIPAVPYALLKVATNLPMHILLTTLAFSLSTIFMNSAVSIALPILGNAVSEMFVYYVERIKILKYFVTSNWDLSVYLFGGEGLVEGLTITKSLIICSIYLLIMIISFAVVFKRRDIKNV